MKIRYYNVWSNDGEWVHGHPPRIWRASEVLCSSDESSENYSKYLLSSLSTDFPAHHPEDMDEVLEDIERLEMGEIEKCYAGTPDTFKHTLTPTHVTFEHSIFGECPEWPIWTCTLAQYKASLQGWRQFVDMPESIDTELIVDLPDG